MFIYILGKICVYRERKRLEFEFKFIYSSSLQLISRDVNSTAIQNNAIKHAPRATQINCGLSHEPLSRKYIKALLIPIVQIFT